MNSSDDSYFLIVANELNNGIRDEGLWMKAFALENGDDLKTKAHYARLRAAKLAQKNNSEKKLIEDVATNGESVNRSPVNAILDKENKRRNFQLMTYAIAIGIALTIGFFVKSNINRDKSHSIPALTETKPSEKTIAPQLSENELILNGIRFEKDGAYTYINIEGEITQKMATLFDIAINDSRFLQPMDMLLLKVNSGGGDLYAAMSIGRALKKRDEARKDRGVFVKPDSKCYSSCIFILAAGLQRVREGSIGIHRPYSTNPKEDMDTISRSLDKIAVDAKSYLREMGVSETLYDHMVNVPPDKIYTFKTAMEMDQYGLLGVDPAFEERKAAIYMKSRGISSRQEYNARKGKADEVCIAQNLISESYGDCYERIMRGG